MTSIYDWDDREYHNWLIRLVGGIGGPYVKLFDILDSIPFRWSIPNDSNRAMDGLDLREAFATWDIPRINERPFRECSCLEMMVALSCRIERDIVGDPGNDHPRIWFWQMIDNLGLGGCYDDNFNETYVVERINVWLDRRFKPDGTGSIFPNIGSQKDQREQEIWMQMNEYLIEHWMCSTGETDERRVQKPSV